MVVAAKFAVDDARPGIAAHSGRTDDVAGAIGHGAMVDRGGSQPREDVVMNGLRRSQSPLDVGIEAVGDARNRNAVDVLCVGIKRDAIVWIGQLLGKGGEPQLARCLPRQLMVERRAAQALQGEVACRTDGSSGRP